MEILLYLLLDIKIQCLSQRTESLMEGGQAQQKAGEGHLPRFTNQEPLKSSFVSVPSAVWGRPGTRALDTHSGWDSGQF